MYEEYLKKEMGSYELVGSNSKLNYGKASSTL